MAQSSGRANEPVFGSRPSWSFADYKRRFDRLHQRIRKGDSYQGNLNFPVLARWASDPHAAFDALTARQPVRYGALVALGDPIVLPGLRNCFSKSTKRASSRPCR